MGFLRNPEVKKSILIWTCISIGIIAIAFLVDIKCGAIMTAACLFFEFMHFFETYKRYNKIGSMIVEIDKILHDCSTFDLSQFEEGELSVLHSEIYKMTMTLREQADSLKSDKKYLADSLADISHQIRTPLTSIGLIAEFLMEKELSQGRRRALVRQLQEFLDRIDWLINTLLKISKLDAGTLTYESRQVNALELIKRAYNPIAIHMDIKNQKFVVECDESVSFMGDLAGTTEALENILKNCMEHTPEGGVLKVEAEETSVYTRITVRDNGPGISAEDLSHIFERFYRGSGSADSSVGIGLALARMIILSQNGTIKAGNNPDGGAYFEIRFYKSIV